jgi:hypothetical protein
LGVTDVAQVGTVLLIMDMLLNLSKFWSALTPTLTCARKTGALLALATRLFNGDCFADPQGCSVPFQVTFRRPKADLPMPQALSAKKVPRLRVISRVSSTSLRPAAVLASIVSASSPPGAFFERVQEGRHFNSSARPKNSKCSKKLRFPKWEAND